MSVLIKDMELPKHCLDCPMCDNNDDCTLQEGKRFDTWGEQMNSCPLIEIPVPHGRLIDVENGQTIIEAEWSEDE